MFRNIKGTSVDILNKKILDVVSLKKYIALNEVYFWQCTPSLLGYTLHFRTTYSCVHRTIWLHKLYSFIYYHGMWLSPVLDGLNVYTCKENTLLHAWEQYMSTVYDLTDSCSKTKIWTLGTVSFLAWASWTVAPVIHTCSFLAWASWTVAPVIHVASGMSQLNSGSCYTWSFLAWASWTVAPVIHVASAAEL